MEDSVKEWALGTAARCCLEGERPVSESRSALGAGCLPVSTLGGRGDASSTRVPATRLGTWTEFWAPGSGLVRPWLSCTFGE